MTALEMPAARGERPADLTWERDATHLPSALTPLAADYVRAMGEGFGGWPRRYSGTGFGDFEQEFWYEVWDGFGYIGYLPEAMDLTSEVSLRRAALGRARADITASYWRDEVVPELVRLYGQMQALPVERGEPRDVADGWNDAWGWFVRTQEIHFECTLGPTAILTELSDRFRAAVPTATDVDAERLIYGVRHELIAAELDLEEVVALAGASDEVATAIRGGIRAISDLRELPGGQAFADAFDAFLDAHGHLGQSADDLALASWAEAPERLVGEIAKRIDIPRRSAAQQLERRAREAADLADSARAALRNEPERLVEFERTLALAREIGPLMQAHNYWIDRRAQAQMRRLGFRVGARLARAGVIDDVADVLYLHRDEIAALVLEPTDRRPLVAKRRAEHLRQLEVEPPRFRGARAPDPSSDTVVDQAKASERVDRDPSEEGHLLRGSGASTGIARGPARITLSSEEFHRVQPGDIIVCRASNPSWVPLFAIAAGLVTDVGGVLSHAAVVAREFGLPAVVGVAGATSVIRDGQQVEIDGLAGTVRLL